MLSVLRHFHRLPWKRVSQNRNHRESPFWERESPVRVADYSASAQRSMLDEHMAMTPSLKFARGLSADSCLSKKTCVPVILLHRLAHRALRDQRARTGVRFACDTRPASRRIGAGNAA